MKPSRPEPLSMTMTDLVMLVIGVALAFVLVQTPESRPHVLIFPTERLLYRVLAVFVGISLSVSVVIFGRLLIYRRAARPAEWLTMLVSILGIVAQSYTIEGFYLEIARAIPRLDQILYSMNNWSWFIALGTSILAAIGLFFIRLSRYWLASWLKTLFLAGIAVVAYLGPISVFERLGADLLAPSQGFGPGVFPILHREICLLFAVTPMALLFGLPVVASISERLRKFSWNWAEWLGSCASISVFVTQAMFFRGEIRSFSWGWLIERIIVLVWILVVGLMCRLIQIYLGPAWTRWIGEIPGQDRSSFSAASTR